MYLEDIQTLTLKASLRKWKKNLKRVHKHKLPKIGADHCPCCKVFCASLCTYCPIKEHTGRQGCVDTPYDLVDRLVNNFPQYPDAEHWNNLTTAVGEEIKFLETVLGAL